MTHFELVLFATDPRVVGQGECGGVDTFIVDWESRGKQERQRGADTEVNYHTLEDLRRVRAATGRHLLCRINGLHDGTPDEVEEAVGAGADEIMVPMVRTPSEVAAVIAMARGRCGVGMLMETMDAVRDARAFGDLPLSRLYVGLNDLAIERRSTSIFAALADGTLDRIRSSFPATRFGFAGLTLPDRGSPIPCRLLMSEMARLRADFSLLRRSFYRDAAAIGIEASARRVREGMDQAFQRGAAEMEADRRLLVDLIGQVAAPPASA